MAEPSGSPLGFIQFGHFTDLGMKYSGNHHLGDSVSSVDDKGLLSPVDQDDSDLSPVVLIDCSGGVHHSDAMFQRYPAAWPDLGFIAGWNRYGQPGRDQLNFTRIQGYGRIHRGSKITSRGAFGDIGRKWYIVVGT